MVRLRDRMLARKDGGGMSTVNAVNVTNTANNAAWDTSTAGEAPTVQKTTTAWERMTSEEKRRELYDRQVAMLATFLEHGAITQTQHDKSLHDLTVKMGYGDE